MIRCIVIDDEPLAVRLISNYVQKHEELELMATFSDPIKALHQLDSLEVDIIFLDIQMPQLSGIQFLQILNNRIQVILCTAYDAYALKSYDYQVVDYLVKPFSFDRFSKAITKFCDNRYNKSAAVEESASTTKIETPSSIFVKSGHRTIRIELDNLLFLESKGDYLYINTANEVMRTLENLKDIATRLPTTFMQCHRSYIVNMNLVHYIENNRIVVGDHHIPVSRAYQAQIQKYIQSSK